MKAFVDRLSAELLERYATYLETFKVGLWSAAGNIEFSCKFALRADQILRDFTLKLPAIDGDTDAERELMIIIVFEQLLHLVDQAISERVELAN